MSMSMSIENKTKKENKIEKIETRLFAYKVIKDFLKNNNYDCTLEMFMEEAADAFKELDENLRPIPDKSLLSLIEDYEETVTMEKLSKMALNKKLNEELNFVSNGKFPKNNIKTYEDVHFANIITVKASSLPTRFLPGSNYDDDKNDIYIFSGSIDKTVRATNMSTGKVLNSYDHHKGAVLSIDFHPTYEHVILTSGMDGYVYIINIDTNEVIQSFKDNQKFVTKALFTPDGEFFVTISYDHTFNIYRKTGETIDEVQQYPLPTYTHVFKKTFTGPVEALCLTTSDELEGVYTAVVGVREDNFLYYIDLVEKKDHQEIDEDFPVTKINMNLNGDNWVSFTPMDLAPSPDNKYILCCTDAQSGRMMLFKKRTNEQPRIFYGAQVDGFSNPHCCFDASGHYVFMTSDDYSICVFEVSTAKLIHKLVGHQAVIRGISYFPPTPEHENGFLLSCSFDKTIRIWEC